MASPFDNNEKFKVLSPEAKQLVLEKFGSLSPEAQKIVSFKLQNTSSRPIPEDVQNEPGLEDISLTPLQKGEFQKGGEDIATGLASKGFNPKLSAAAGTTFAMIPHVVTSLIGPKGTKTAAEVLPAVKEGVMATGEAIANSPITKAIMNTGAKEVGTLAEKMATLPLQQTAKRTLAETAKKEAGSAIGEAEKGLNIGLSDTSSNLMQSIYSSKDKLTKFADRASKLAEKGSDKLAEMASPETLQFYRKTAQKGIKQAGLDDIARSKLYQVNKIFGDALAKVNEPFGEALGRFKEAESVLKELPAEFTRQKQVLKLALVRAKNLATKQAPIRKVVGIGIGGGAAATSYKLGKKLFVGD